MDDRYHLQRFVEAQQPVFDAACAELRAAKSKATGCGSSFRRSRAWAQAGWRAAQEAEASVFAVCLRKYFGGQPDAATLAKLSQLAGETP